MLMEVVSITAAILWAASPACSCNNGFVLAKDNLNCTGKKLQLTMYCLHMMVSLWHVSMQMLMSVLLVLIDVHRRVQTLLVAISVVVVQDIL